MVIEPIHPNHDRLAFVCGNVKLDRYIRDMASQAKRNGLAATFVAIDPQGDPTKILGYYSLSNFVIEGLDIPEVVRRARKLPAHSVGATLLGRLAVAKSAQGMGIGQLLLVDALKRAYLVSAEVGSVAVVVDAIDANVAGWYQQFGFARMISDDFRLVLMMDTIGQRLPGTTFSPFVEQPESRSA